MRRRIVKEGEGEWEDITIDQATAKTVNGKKYYEAKLRLGGAIKFYPNFVDEDLCQQVETDTTTSGLLREYKIQGAPEPRLHCLLSADKSKKSEVCKKCQKPRSALTKANDNKKAHCYQYHNIRMKAVATIDSITSVDKISNTAAEACGLKEGWNIGCDVILYRNFQDKIGAHADDTQGETVVFCAIIASEAVANSKHDIRALKVVVKTTGDEEFLILAGRGDAYEMDGMFVTAFWNVLVLLQYTCWYLARETTCELTLFMLFLFWCE